MAEKVRITLSASDLEAWILARVAKGAARLVLMAEDRPHGAHKPPVAVTTWDVRDTFEAREVARYVQALANAMVVLGDPREHFDLWSYRHGRSTPSARVTVYGQEPTGARACADCARKEARVAKLGEQLRNAHAMIEEAHARNDRLDEIIRKQRDALTVADAHAPPWASPRVRKPLTH